MALLGNLLGATDASVSIDDVSDTDTSDAALVMRARNGDREAEEILYRRHVRYIHGLLFRLLANPMDAEDAIQDSFAIALDQLGSLRDPAAFRGWLAQIAVSQARRIFRKRKLLRLLGLDGRDDSRAIDLVVDGELDASTRAEIATLNQLLDRLPINERLAWSLRRIAGHSLEEIASHCRCSLATVKRRVAAADSFIHVQFDDREETS